jgi:DNA-binding NtrC family response regulator
VKESVYAVGAALSTRTLREDVEAAANSDASVLITGDSGVGKNAVAQLIHLQSRRGPGPLVTVDCAADVSAETFERLDMAHGGTILIDHIEETSTEMQAYLAQFLETRGRVLDVRVIAAADCNLLDKVAAGEFREDLYYRLNIIHVVMPPVRERDDGHHIPTTLAF